ncbi:MAG: hypothetical protein MRERV_3c112 [Mycoplasmataceae bacterium RV_VA103A]|nr:MAG: hypothetical protein MRERV_3c112 [Mycoplasmataceae bacterium RV_VA103A]
MVNYYLFYSHFCPFFLKVGDYLNFFSQIWLIFNIKNQPFYHLFFSNIKLSKIWGVKMPWYLLLYGVLGHCKIRKKRLKFLLTIGK